MTAPSEAAERAFAARLARGPDPVGAAVRWSRFREAGGVVPVDDEGIRLLAALLASGEYLTGLLVGDPAALPRLHADPFLRAAKPATRFAAEVAAAAAGARDLADLQRRLRRHARGEMLRLGARELGWGATMDVARELAALADACLEAATAFALAARAAAHGPPLGAGAAVVSSGAGGARAPIPFTVLGLGKLGANELNFSSDVDLMFLYGSDDGVAGSLSLHEFFAGVAQDVTRALGDVTADGFVFRVDLRLRPEGRSGPICNALPAALAYYETFGRTWERQALLRARVSAGDRALGGAFLGALEPFVYPRSIGPEAVGELRALRALYRVGDEHGPYDVKLGGGGIRDVELCAHVLQLLHGGRRRELRERGTLAALHKLGVAGLLDDREVRALSDGYVFWRRVEHRLQVRAGAQTQRLPEDAAELDILARGLDYPDAAAFLAEIDRRRAEIAAVAATIGAPPPGPSALALRLLDTAAPPESLAADLAAAGFADPARATRDLDIARARLPAEWLDQALASPDPDRALAHFRDLALRASFGLPALLREEPALLRVLARLFATSDRLSRLLIYHPTRWAGLVTDLGDPRPDPTRARAQLDERLAGLSFEDALRELRRFQAGEILRIGLHDVGGTLDPREVSEQLGALAAACIGAATDRVVAELAARYPAPSAGFAVVGMGSLGAGEMRYGSDLDLVFLYEQDGETAQGMDHQEWFARLSQRLISALSAMLDEGRLYDVDTRLRPSGSQGLLVTSAAAFAAYHEREAALWERVALLRARVVHASSSKFGAQVATLLHGCVHGRPLDVDALRTELRRMRARIESERVPSRAGGVHLRFGPGGLTDLEFLSALAAMQAGGGPDVPAALSGAYRFLQRASLRLRLLREQSDDWLADADRPALARSLGVDLAAFSTELAAVMARVRAAYDAQL